MIVTLKPDADVGAVVQALTARGLWTRRLDGGARHLVVEAHSARVEATDLLSGSGVADVAVAPSPHPLVDAQPQDVALGRVLLGAGRAPVLMAGPCSVESPEDIERLAASVAQAGARVLRGGALKPRTSPYSFQGHGVDALRWMRAAADRHGLAVVTEALGEGDADAVAEYSDLVQVGSRNMQNFALLKAVGRTRRPVLLKRGMCATIEEWLLAAEHLRHAGAPVVVFCERGIRSFDPRTRNVLDVGAIALLAQVHRVPVVVDPSHAAGRRDLVVALARAGLAAGACGLLVEAHHDPGRARSDGPQALPLDELASLARTIGVHDVPA